MRLESMAAIASTSGSCAPVHLTTQRKCYNRVSNQPCQRSRLQRYQQRGVRSACALLRNGEPRAIGREGALEKVEAFAATASGADLELQDELMLPEATSSEDGTDREQTSTAPLLEPLIAPLAHLAQETELRSLEVLSVPERRYEALAGWVGIAVAFGLGIWFFEGPVKAQEYFAGYLLEQSLSVDNLFVFVLVFGYFKVPPVLQNKVLTYGIMTAAILRAVMVIVGIELITQFRPLLACFAGILLYSSYQLLAEREDDNAEEGDLSGNALVNLCRKYIKVSDHYDGDKFFTTAADGTRLATPLLLVLAVVELSDVVFAVDSIPAVFGVTLDPFIVYTSNIFAILSLRSLYAFVSTVMSELRYLDKAVAIVLGFIGTKMLLEFVDVDIPTDVSLLVVGLLLGGGVAASLLLPEDAAAPPTESERKP